MFVCCVELLRVMFTSGSEDRTFLIVSERATRHQHNVLMKVLIESRVFDF